MKILITGANGQLGKELIHRITEVGWEYYAASRDKVDITNPLQTADVIRGYSPDTVIHCAAYTNVDGAESNTELAYKINAVGTQNVAAACLQCDAKMVYISTDYVFDGMLGRPFNEFDQPNPQNIYGKSKYAGEVLARQIMNKLFLIRTAWLYGDGNNFVRTMLKLGEECRQIRVVNDQYGSPTNTRDLAQAILCLIPTDAYGIYHGVNRGITTWHNFAKKIFEITANPRVAVLPQSTAELNRPAYRPLYSPLENNMIKPATGHDMRHWEEALQEYIEDIMA